jgi:phospholipase/carboxylesterase
MSTAPEQLVVFLHGYGANGNDLIAIGKQWRNLMPGAAFVAPNAPEPCAQAPGGRQWFRLTMRDPNRTLDRRQQGVPGSRRVSRCRT